MEKRKTVILGASAFGIAYALGSTDALILENGAQLAPEYIGSMDARVCRPGELCPEAEELKRECAEKSLLSDTGVLHALPAASLLAERLLNSKVELRFLAAVTDRQRIAGVWIIRYTDPTGIHTVCAENLVDTTVHTGGRKQLCVVYLGHPDSGTVMIDGAETVRGFFDDTWIAKYPVENDADWTEAREHVYSLWQEKPAPGLRMASVAPVFSWRYPCPSLSEGQGEVSAAAGSFEDIFFAYREGTLCAIRHA